MPHSLFPENGQGRLKRVRSVMSISTLFLIFLCAQLIPAFNILLWQVSCPAKSHHCHFQLIKNLKVCKFAAH